MPASRLRDLAHGWRGVCLVAITYVYFLIFAQFAFLKRLGELGIADAHLQSVMAAMAAAGIGFSLLASLQALAGWERLRVQLSLLVCAAAAGLTLMRMSLPAAIAIAALIGAGLGMLTVTLVANLRLWLGSGGGLWKVGAGTGMGYFVCNIPALFTASPGVQAAVAAVLCVLGIVAASVVSSPAVEVHHAVPQKRPTFAFVLLAFTALVWLDSAAFFIIQNTPALKAGTWQGTLHLWDNAVIHLSAALASGSLLRRHGFPVVLGSAVLLLAAACLLLHQPGGAVLASFFYPAGVSLYSVALVAYPSLMISTSSRQRVFRAALIYAVAGWVGSAMGIGMGQHLHRVPGAFVLLATVVVLGPAISAGGGRYWREYALVGGALALAYGVSLILSTVDAQEAVASTAEQRGRQVYIAEGCINCHSQYVRPGTQDVLLWGPVESIAELRAQHPPLIGNRRQGPDLSEVGGRRSPLWLKAHFMDPRAVSYASFMPAYGYLFNGSTRGDDLIRYLASLKGADYAQHIADEQLWRPSAEALAAGNAQDGAHGFGQYCTTCHEIDGATRNTWQTQFKRLPPNLQTGPWLHIPVTEPSGERMLRIAQIIKFGIPGTDMPGHEYLSDKEVTSIALWLNQTLVQPRQLAMLETKPGENR